MNPLEASVNAWDDSAQSVLVLLADLTEPEWSRPTDCPDWTVKDVAAHLAHLEHELAAGAPTAPDPSAKIVTSSFTEAGVQARRGHTTDALMTELRAAVTARAADLADLPADPHSLASPTPGGVAWSWDTLLRNRAIDVWVHEQDIRRATDRPGSLGSPGAWLTTLSFKSAMGYVVGKKVQPPAGTSIGWHVTGEVPFDLTVAVGDDGRATATASIDEPTVLLTMSSEDFAVLGAGRRMPDQLDITVAGDSALAQSVLAAMTLTF